MNRSIKIIAVLEIVTGIGLVLFWTAFFTIGLAPANPPSCYFAFEHSFPTPDLLLALGLLIAGSMTLKGKQAGRLLSLTCAGALMFLGVLDTSFNLQNGMYLISVGDTIGNAFINLWCMGFGACIAYIFIHHPAPGSPEKCLDNPL